LLLQAWVPEKSVFFSLNAVSWSLSVEAFFYVLFPFLILRWRISWHVKLLLAFAVVGAGVAFVNAAGLPFEPPKTGPSAVGILYVNPAMRLFEFTVGIAIYFLHRVLEPAWKSQTTAQSTCLEVVAVVGVGVALNLCFFLNSTSGITSWIGLGGQAYLQQEGASIAFAFLILAFAMNKGVLARLLSLPFFVLLGEISFSLYLVHTSVLKYFEPYEGIVGVHRSAWYVKYWLVCLGLSLLMHVSVERPMRRMIVGVYERFGAGRSMPMLPRDGRHPRFASLAFLGLIAVVACAVLARPSTLDTASDVAATRATLAAEIPLRAQPVIFGDSLRLNAVGIDRGREGVTELTFIMTALKALRLDSAVGVHALGTDGKILGGFDTALDKSESAVSAGTNWRLTARASTTTLRAADSLGLLIYKVPDPPLLATGERRDWEGRRVLLKIGSVP